MSKTKIKSEWIDEGGYQEIQAKDCLIILEPRPWYCDRGNYVAKIMAHGELARDLDHCDMWPRYYMDLDRAKLEIEAWLRKREQWVD
jgi:hypothetical protein